MPVTLKVVLGEVNFTDYLRVTAAKVSAPSTDVFVEYINTPVSSYVLVIPGLDPDDYYLRFYDAPDTLSTGTLVSEAYVNAQSGEFEYERRFYRIGSLPSGVTLTGTTLYDPYLENKNVTGVFKEGLRYLDPDTEWTFDDAAAEIELTGTAMDLAIDEVLIVEIKYNVGLTASVSTASIFADTITVTAATYTINATDKGKRFCLDCLGPKQEVTMPPLSSLATGDIIYLEHKRDGVQAQSRIVTSGTDKVLFNGFDLGTNELDTLFLSKGQSLYFRKEDSYWEIIFDYAGTRVGERMSSTWRNQPNWIPEDGRLMDGDEYPGLYWWLREVVDNTHYITDDTVTGGGYTHPAGKEGLFVIHSALKKFRMPNTQGLSERGLLDFDSYGADTARVYDYPGGVQNDTNKKFWSGTHTTLDILKEDGTNTEIGTDSGAGSPNIRQGVNIDQTKFSDEVRVKNIGVIYMRHI